MTSLPTILSLAFYIHLNSVIIVLKTLVIECQYKLIYNKSYSEILFDSQIDLDPNNLDFNTILSENNEIHLHQLFFTLFLFVL